MRILIVSQYYISRDPEGNVLIPGGTERYSYGLAKQLSIDGFEVMILSCGEKSEVGYDSIDSIACYKFKQPRIYEFIDVFSFFATLKMIRDFNPDIVHVVSCGYHFALGAITASKIMRKKTVFTVQLPPNMDRKDLLRVFDRRIVSKIIEKTDVVISPSMEVEKILACEINAEKIVVIPNFTTCNYYRKIPKEVDSIIFVGRLMCKQKGIDLLINSLPYVKKSIPGAKLHICGDGSDRKYLENLVSKKDLKENVVFHGHLDDNTLTKLYSKSHVFVMPSLYESFGIVIVEAMSAGLPVIAYDLDCISEILDNGKYGILVRKGEVNELADQIIELLKNDNLREYYSTMSMQRYNDYTQESVVERIEKIYLDIKGGTHEVSEVL